MVDDSERREAARRLREIDAERLDRFYTMDGEGGECEDPGMAKAGRCLMLGAIAEAVGMHFAPYCFDAAPLRDRLADLIDPDSPHFADVGKMVDRDALLALADEMDRSAHESEAYFACVHPVDILEYARRIREACGEGEA